MGLTARGRVIVVVAAVTVAAVGAVVGITLATRTNPHRSATRAPVFAADPTAPPGLARDVRDALAAWPNGTVRRLRLLAAQHPHSALVRFELGLALALSGQVADGRNAWRAARRAQPDSPSAVRAEDALHPEAPPGKPPFVPAFARPRNRVQRLLVRGVIFQQQLRPLSAERVFAAAAALAPGDPEAQVAAAVGRYDKDNPSLAFGSLGPLARRFPHAQTVRFHLGLLLIYLRQFPQARKELALAVAEGRETPLGKRARTLLRASRNA